MEFRFSDGDVGSVYVKFSDTSGKSHSTCRINAWVPIHDTKLHLLLEK